MSKGVATFESRTAQAARGSNSGLLWRPRPQSPPFSGDFYFFILSSNPGICSRQSTCSCTSRRSFASHASTWLTSNRFLLCVGVPGTRRNFTVSMVVGMRPLYWPTILASCPLRVIQ